MGIEKPVFGKLTQGTIFTSASAEEYVNKPVWGMCITARCDMAHENKTNVFNYLPIVSFDEWLLKDGARLLCDRLHIELTTKAINLIKNALKSPTILDSYTPDFIADNFMSGNSLFKLHSEKMNELAGYRANRNISSAEVKNLVAINIKCAEKLLKDLWSMQLPGYYFLKEIGDTEHSSNAGYVVLLREIHHLPQTLGSKIANGMIIEQGSKPQKTPFDFSYPTGLVSSPWIEHIMQQFSHMFVRIGLPDPNPLHLKKLTEMAANGY